MAGAGAGGLNSHEFQLNQIHHHHHHFDPLSSADDFLDQILSAVPPSSPWSSAAPDLIKPAWADSSSPGDDNVAAGFFDDPAAINVASKLRQQQLLMIAAGAPPSDQALFNGFGCIPSEPHLHHPTGQSFGAGGGQSAAAAAAAGQGQSQGKPKVRARRGQATDPHSIAERLRRERIAERMKALQELVPNGNKTDKASMLDEIIDYVKFLQLQVKVISMSRLGGAGAPLVANMSSKWGGGDCIQDSGGNGIVSGGGVSSSSNDGSLTMTEQQVAKLMEEDMGSAMQYLQGKGLCLMPISLATAISTATCPPGNGNHHRHRQQPSSPNVNGDAAVKDSTSATKP